MLPDTDGIPRLVSGKAINTMQAENNFESGLVIERIEGLRGEHQYNGETQNTRDGSRQGHIKTLKTDTKNAHHHICARQNYLTISL